MLQIFYELTPNVYTEMQTIRYKSFKVGTMAAVGQAHTGNIPFDDPGGTYEVKGWRKVRVYETTASPTLLWSGRIRNKTVKRGDSERASLRTGADRWWDCDAIDQNTLMGARIIRGTSANRPAESAGERLAWLLSTSFTIYVDNGHVTYPSDRLDPNDYTGMTAADVIADCATPGGYNFFALQVDDTDFPELFFMLPGDSDWASTISISDDPADYDGETVFLPNYEAELAVSDEIVASGVFLPYDGGDTSAYVYVSDSAIGDEFAFVDKAAPMATVKTSTKATVIANRHLALSSTEAEKITCTIHVPADKANALRPWHRVAYKSTWMPRFETYRDCRVIDWSIEQQPFEGGGDGYLIHLELSPVEDYVPALSCSTSLSNIEATTLDDLQVASSGSFSLGVTPSYAGPTVMIASALVTSGNPGTTIGAFSGGYSSLNYHSTNGLAIRIGFQQGTAPGTFTVGASWTAYGDGGNLIVNAAIPSSASGVVQDYWAVGAGAALPGTPTVGNIVVMLCHTWGGNVINGPGPTGPTTGWTLLGSVTNNSSMPVPPYNGINKASIFAYARCVESGEDGTYSFNITGGYPGNFATYLAEIAP